MGAGKGATAGAGVSGVAALVDACNALCVTLSDGLASGGDAADVDAVNLVAEPVVTDAVRILCNCSVLILI